MDCKYLAGCHLGSGVLPPLAMSSVSFVLKARLKLGIGK